MRIIRHAFTAAEPLNLHHGVALQGQPDSSPGRMNKQHFNLFKFASLK
jgi:hypothetical protein